MITATQCRAARAILGWSVKGLAAKARLSPNTVVRFENEIGTSNATTQVVLKQAFEAAGVRFTEDGGIVPPKKGGAE
jgi:ribosome-binding protein aMBF1 (putative translation factor)